MTDLVTRGIDARFWGKVKKTDTCWLWTAGKTARGYGTFFIRKHYPVGAHRFSYGLIHGSIPTGFMVCHSCDNPSCVNPQHLFLGTQKDNMRDCHRKGRTRGLFYPGQTAREQNPNAKLNSEIVRQIRTLSGHITQRQIAKLLGVDRTTVQCVIYNKTWKENKVA